MNNIIINSRKLDPTKTTTLQVKFAQDIRGRLLLIKSKILKAVYKEDVLGLKKQNIHNVEIELPKNAFKFKSSSEKVELFTKWIKGEVEKDVLGIYGDKMPAFTSDWWAEKYITSSYKKGILEASKLAKESGAYKELTITPEGTFLQTADKNNINAILVAPIHAEPLKLLYTRTFNELKGITNDLDKIISKELTMALANGWSAQKTAKALASAIDNSNLTQKEKEEFQIKGFSTLQRARMIARTEIVRANNEARLNEFERLGFKEVGVEVEWSTAGDDRVCPICADMNGAIIPIDKARNMIPLHPNCRCCWVTPPIKIEKVKLPEKQVNISEISTGIDGAEEFGKRLKLTQKSIGGSTGARVYIDNEGVEWMVKDYSGNELRAINEYIANSLYRELGVKVPEARLAKINNRIAVASKRLTDKGLREMGSEYVDWASGTSTIKGGFFADAWLANWDVAGMGWDNILVVPNKVQKIYRIDQGGALFFRAQGGLKGVNFGTVVQELESLRDNSINPYTAQLFQNIDDEYVVNKMNVKFLDRIKKSNWRQIIRNSGLEAEKAEELIKILDGRLEYMEQWRKKRGKELGFIKTRGRKKKAVIPPKKTEKIDITGLEGEEIKITDEELEAIKKARGNGWVIRTDGDDFEDSNVYIWIEKNANGKDVVKLWGTLSERKLEELKELVGGVSEVKIPPEINKIFSLSDSITEKLKETINSIIKNLKASKKISNSDILQVQEIKEALKDLRIILESKEISNLDVNVKLVISDLEQVIHKYEYFSDVIESGIQAKTRKFRLWVLKDLEYFDEEKYKKIIKNSEKKVNSLFKPVSTKISDKKPLKSTLDIKFYQSNINKGYIQRTKRIQSTYKEEIDVFRNIRGFEAKINKTKVQIVDDYNRYTLDRIIQLETDYTGKKEDVDRLFETLKELGIKNHRATKTEIETQWLKQNYLLAAGNGNPTFDENSWVLDEIKELLRKEKQIKEPEKLRDLWLKALNEKLERDIKKDKRYKEAIQGIRDNFGNGRYNMRRIDLTEKDIDLLKKETGFLHESDTDPEELMDKILNSGGHLVGNKEKIRRGIPPGGISPGDDILSGGGRGVYTRIKHKKELYNNFLGYDEKSVFILKSDNLIERTDAAYLYDDNLFNSGDILTEEYRVYRNFSGSAKNILDYASGNNEVIFDDTISLLDELDYIVVRTEEKRNKIIDLIKKHKIEKIGGKRVEDVVVVGKINK